MNHDLIIVILILLGIKIGFPKLLSYLSALVMKKPSKLSLKLDEMLIEAARKKSKSDKDNETRD